MVEALHNPLNKGFNEGFYFVDDIVASPGASSYTYAEATWTQSLLDRTGSHTCSATIALVGAVSPWKGGLPFRTQTDANKTLTRAVWRCLALSACSLALRGEALFLIRNVGPAPGAD